MDLVFWNWDQQDSILWFVVDDPNPKLFIPTSMYVLQKICKKPKVSIQIIKSAKSLNMNNPKYKKEEVQTNEQTLILWTPMDFSQGDWDEVWNENQTGIN